MFTAFKAVPLNGIRVSSGTLFDSNCGYSLETQRQRRYPDKTTCMTQQKYELNDNTATAAMHDLLKYVNKHLLYFLQQDNSDVLAVYLWQQKEKKEKEIST